MNPMQLLKTQHREVKKLFKEVTSAENGDRKTLLSQIEKKLRVHTAIEEEIFYPTLREVGGEKAPEMIDEAVEEHHVVKLVLDELPSVDPDDDRFTAKMTVLSELVEHHVQEEEGEMFKLAEKLDAKELSELGRLMQERAARDAAPPRPKAVHQRA